MIIVLVMVVVVVAVVIIITTKIISRYFAILSVVSLYLADVYTVTITNPHFSYLHKNSIRQETNILSFGEYLYIM
jgi:hypothetical protein